MASLTWWEEGGKQRVYRISKPITTVGSDAQCDVRVAGLAGQHATVVFDGRDFYVHAIEEAPVQVGKKNRRKARLGDQACLRLGTRDFVFHLLDAPVPTVRGEEGRDRDVAGLRKLQEFSSRLMAHENIDALLEALMDAVVELTGAAKGFLILFEDDRPVIKVARNLRKENLGTAEEQLSDSIVAQVIRTKQPVIVSDAQRHDVFSSAQSVLNLQLSSVMCTPLLYKGTLIGIIYLGNDDIRNLFEPSLLEILSVFAAQAALLVHNALLLDDLKVKAHLSDELSQTHFGSIIGASEAMQQVFRRIDKVAPADVSVLISGETGTGKELVAREIHLRSNRRHGPFVTVNCGAVPETLMESEFFGYVRGAFTGADATRGGKFQAADKGTIFLDEIGEMPLSLQVKLLRVLQEHQVTKVGANKPESLDIRVLAATNRNLEEEVAKGTFREDLYYRLNVITVHLPPLRERGEDCVLLARFLLRRYAQEFNPRVRGFTPAAVAAVRQHGWPGNVRELENRVKKAVILCDGTLVGPEDLDLGSAQEAGMLPLAQAREEFQRKYILEAVERCGGNRTKAAQLLDVDPRTVYRYLEKDVS